MKRTNLAIFLSILFVELAYAQPRLTHFGRGYLGFYTNNGFTLPAHVTPTNSKDYQFKFLASTYNTLSMRLMYNINDHWGIQADAGLGIRTWSSKVTILGRSVIHTSKEYESNLGLGLTYRFLPHKQWVPYAVLGMNFPYTLERGVGFFDYAVGFSTPTNPNDLSTYDFYYSATTYEKVIDNFVYGFGFYKKLKKSKDLLSFEINYEYSPTVYLRSDYKFKDPNITGTIIGKPSALMFKFGYLFD